MRKTLWTLIVVLAAVVAQAQVVRYPNVTGSGTTISWSAGTILNGGHAVSIAAGTGSATTSKGDCSAPSFANCNFVYSNSSGTVAVTTTLATAQSGGNVLLAFVETSGSAITATRMANQSGTIMTQALGPLSTFSSSVTLGTNGGTAGSAVFNGSTSGAVTVQPGSATAGTYNFNLPTSAGTTGAPLVSQGGVGSAQVYPTAALFTGTGQSVLTLGLAGTATGSLGLSGTTSGTVSINPQAVAGSYNFNMPITAGSTGAPLLSQGGGATAQIYGNNALFTGTLGSTLTLGAAGSVVGNLAFLNATSGTITVAPPTGALGTPTVTLPLNTGGVPIVGSCGSTGSGNQTCSPAAASGKTQVYSGSSTLSANAAVITFPTGFTSTTSYQCVANDVTTRANVVQMIPASATTATITNTTGATDVVQWICAGN